jgi:hypothetical protein
MMPRIPRPSRPTDPLSDLRHLTSRDRTLLGWLAEHYVLTTEQITAGLFPSQRVAQKRLALLHRIDAVARFRFADTHPTHPSARLAPLSYRYTLGRLGMLLHPDAYADPDNPAARSPRSDLERRGRIARSPQLNHLLGVNQFFIDLHAHARTHSGTRLARWWSEQHATAVYSTAARVQPDGHGIWEAADRRVGFFLEHDNATEDLPRVIGKLKAYETLATSLRGPRYSVLLWVPDRVRETNLLRALTGVSTAMPVATAVHNHDPAGPRWALPGDAGPRLHLHELPETDE